MPKNKNWDGFCEPSSDETGGWLMASGLPHIDLMIFKTCEQSKMSNVMMMTIDGNMITYYNVLLFPTHKNHAKKKQDGNHEPESLHVLRRWIDHNKMTVH